MPVWITGTSPPHFLGEYVTFAHRSQDGQRFFLQWLPNLADNPIRSYPHTPLLHGGG